MFCTNVPLSTNVPSSRTQLYVAMDQNYIEQDTFDRLSALAIEINQKLSGLMKYLRHSEFKGSKFK